jgi:hypothetical protein
MPGGSPRRNHLPCRAGCGVEQLDTVRFAHGDRTDPRRSDDDSFGRIADGHPDARGRRAGRCCDRGLSRWYDARGRGGGA